MTGKGPVGAGRFVRQRKVLVRPEFATHSEATRLRGTGWWRFAESAGISLVVHGGLLVLLTFVTWAVGIAGEFVPEFRAQIAEAPKRVGPAGGFRFHGRANVDRPDDPRAKPAETIHDLAALMTVPDEMTPADSSSSGSELDAATSGGLGRSDIIGIGTGGMGDGKGPGGPGRRSLAGGGPVGSMWGVGEGQRADSIVYVLDRSGSMADTFDLLKRELRRAIGSLESDQLFNVIWFSEGKATELSARMFKATVENKRVAFAAINRIVPSGQTEPMDAVRRGLAHQPDVLFLLSDGDFGEYNEQVIRLIRDRNKGGRTTVNTILFVYDTVGDGERVLRAIADANGGTYKHVTEEDVRR
jgi:hypothetical protein